MPYDVALEYRIDTELAGRGVALEKKRMFGGICYLVNGNIAFGVRKDELLVRVSDTNGKKLLQQPSVRHFEMG